MIDVSGALTQINTWIQGDTGAKAAVVQQAHVGQVQWVVVYHAVESKHADETYCHAFKFAAFKAA